MNFDFITDNMSVGTTPETSADVQTLVDAGITHVLNCRDDHDDAALLAGRFEYCWNGTPDWNPSEPFGGEPKPVEWFAHSLAFWGLPKAITFKYKLYVHCTAGVNRSATTAWMFLRALQLKAVDCDLIVDNRLVAVWGTLFDKPWRKNAEDALRTLGYIS